MAPKTQESNETTQIDEARALLARARELEAEYAERILAAATAANELQDVRSTWMRIQKQVMPSGEIDALAAETHPPRDPGSLFNRATMDNADNAVDLWMNGPRKPNHAFSKPRS